jgi:hypothetical protein
VPQPKASGDHNVAQHQKAFFEISKRFMDVIVFPKTHWLIISNEQYPMSDETWKLAIEAHDHLRAVAGGSVGTPSGRQLPSGSSRKIYPQNQHAGRV